MQLSKFAQVPTYIDNKGNHTETSNPVSLQSVDTKSLSTLGLYKDQLRTQILKNKYQLGTRCDSKKEDQGPGLKVIF